MYFDISFQVSGKSRICTSDWLTLPQNRWLIFFGPFDHYYTLIWCCFLSLPLCHHISWYIRISNNANCHYVILIEFECYHSLNRFNARERAKERGREGRRKCQLSSHVATLDDSFSLWVSVEARGKGGDWWKISTDVCCVPASFRSRSKISQ